MMGKSSNEFTEDGHNSFFGVDGTLYAIDKLRYRWEIKNTDFLDHTMDFGYVSSPVICCQNNPQVKWRFKLYPNGISKKYHYCSIYLESSNPDFEIFAGWTVDIVNNLDEKAWSCKFPFCKFNGKCKGMAISHNTLINSSQYIIDGKLTLKCKIESAISFSSAVLNLKVSNNEKLKPRVDLSKLFGNNEFSDIIFIAEDQQFSAHKAVLSSASPIFWKMFANGTRNEISTILIQDISPKILREMLRHIYLNKIENLIDLAPELIVVANKFGLENLKVISEQAMIQNLKPDNLLNLLLIADTYKCEIRRFRIYELFALHKSMISKTSLFKEMMISHPLLITTLCVSLCNK